MRSQAAVPSCWPGTSCSGIKLIDPHRWWSCPICVWPAGGIELRGFCEVIGHPVIIVAKLHWCGIFAMRVVVWLKQLCWIFLGCASLTPHISTYQIHQQSLHVCGWPRRFIVSSGWDVIKSALHRKPPQHTQRRATVQGLVLSIDIASLAIKSTQHGKVSQLPVCAIIWL